MPTEKKENAGKLTDPTPPIERGETGTLAWADIEEALSDEWEIGGLARPNGSDPRPHCR